MKVSYNEACTLHNSDLETDLRLAEEIGFSHIEMRLDKLQEYLRTHTLEDLKAFFQKSRIRPHAINGIYTYTEFLGEEDDPERAQALLADIKFCCEVCVAVGSKDLIMVPPIFQEAEERPYTDPWEKILRDNVRIFKKMADFVAPYGVRIGIEIVGAPRCSIRTIEQCNKVLQLVDKPNVGYTLDAFNLYLYSKNNDFSEIQNADASRIFVVHINGGEEGELKDLRQSYRTFCDRGVMNVENYLQNLKSVGYDGPVSIEFFRKDCWERPARDVIQECYRTTKAVMQKCNTL